ncbi:Fe-S cluster assembly protein SufD [Pantoea sp. 1.19]|uniref:Fe-S cluster assembly protein SufD n=1 Tax=Pantoea sp. 1.19 TaxID=1925589 RepID=UPI000948F92D|nr:Fe-S cluster assembly protein SufD [Pantoea sp. 1.19]
MAGLPTKHNPVPARWQQLFDGAPDRGEQAREHWQELQRHGLPGPRHEDWKYTPLNTLLTAELVQPAPRLPDAARCRGLALPLDAVRLVFVDGHYQPTLSDGDLDAFQLRVYRGGERPPLAAAIQPEAFLHLTESLAAEVAVISLARHQRAPRPLYLLHISSGAPQGLATHHYRHHVALEAGAEATVVEHYVSLDDRPHFTGGRTTLAVGDNAALQHYKLAFEQAASVHFAHNDLTLARAARASSHSFLLGAGLSRHHTSAQLQGEGGDVVINSLALPVDNEVCDTRSWLEHRVGHCQSRQLHKTIVRDKGRAVFNGMIKVAEHALKTDGQMTNNNLLLGRLAEVDTKPQLEIYADDVKCSHGATVGRIDDEQLFYLRSRGIAEAAAQQMIIFAFAAELTEALTDPAVKQAVMQRIAQRFPGGVHDPQS